METSQGYVNVTTDEKGITTIAFFHPAQNSLPTALLDLLASTIHKVGSNDQTRVIILKSDGDRTFCAVGKLGKIKVKVEEGCIRLSAENR